MVSVVVPIYNEEELIIRFMRLWRAPYRAPLTIGKLCM